MPPFLSFIVSVLKKYNAEPVIFAYFIARNLYTPTLIQQLITDKICLNDYNQDRHFCYNICSDEHKGTKNVTIIQGDAVNYVMYSQMILSIPSIFAAIFLGIY